MQLEPNSLPEVIEALWSKDAEVSRRAARIDLDVHRLGNRWYRARFWLARKVLPELHLYYFLGKRRGQLGEVSYATDVIRNLRVDEPESREDHVINKTLDQVLEHLKEA